MELARTRPRPPVRALHLGLGNFFRAHQAVFTAHSDPEWGIAAFTGSSPRAALAMERQDCVYTVDVRSAEGDTYEQCEAIAAAHPADNHAAWTGYWADPAVQYLTITVTEAGYRPRSGVDTRILAGLQARRDADAGPISLIPCDNLPSNAGVLRRLLTDLAERIDPGLLPWMDANVGFVSTTVDRITPATSEADRQRVATALGVRDEMPVVTEPYAEWVLSDTFAGQRPALETAGAVITDDVHPYEARKLTLLNGAHSLLAYVGSLRGHTTVAEAIADPACREWVLRWWAEAGPHLSFESQGYQDALLLRFANPAIAHQLTQVAMDGSQKLPVRLVPTIRAERDAGRIPQAAVRILAAWIVYLRDDPAPDPKRELLVHLANQPLGQAVPSLLAVIDQELPDDHEFVEAVLHDAARL